MSAPPHTNAGEWNKVNDNYVSSDLYDHGPNHSPSLKLGTPAPTPLVNTVFEDERISRTAAATGTDEPYHTTTECVPSAGSPPSDSLPLRLPFDSAGSPLDPNVTGSFHPQRHLDTVTSVLGGATALAAATSGGFHFELDGTMPDVGTSASDEASARVFHFGGASVGGMEEEMATCGNFAALHPSAMNAVLFAGSDDHASSTAGGPLAFDRSYTHNTREG